MGQMGVDQKFKGFKNGSNWQKQWGSDTLLSLFKFKRYEI